MSRIITTLGGRLGSSAVQGIDLGPTGQFAWGAGGTPVNPQLIFQTSSVYTGETVSRRGIFSYWYLAPASTSDVNLTLKFESSTGVHVFNEVGLSGDAPVMNLRAPDKTSLVDVTAASAASASAWHHVLWSWDIGVGNTYANDFHLYVDDVDQKPGTPAAFLTTDDVEWGTGNLFVTNYRMGVVDSQLTAPTLRHAAWYLNYNEYLDFSVTANRRKFIDASGDPVALGVDGSLPTGSQPLFYFDNDAANVLTNRGSAGNFLAGATIIGATGPNP